MAKDKEQAIIEVVIKGQQANATIKDMEKAVNALRAQLYKLPKDSQEFLDKKAEFQKMSSNLKQVQNDVKGIGGVFQGISKELKAFGVFSLIQQGLQMVGVGIKSLVDGNAKLSDSLADIRKTTGMTESEVKKFNTTLGQINTRTATKELRDIAIVGGQLGITKNDIYGFTVAVDKMNVALGDEFTGGAEEVTKAMGGLRNIFSDIKTDKVDQDLLHIGNAINELASQGAATGPVVADFANRIGGVGITLGLTSGQVLGLSATLQELNVSTERGGTAVTKILQKMTTNTAEFAKVADMNLQDFTNLVNNDLYGAFIKVVEGSNKSGASATAFGNILDKLGVDGAGASEVFAKLGNNTKMLGEKVGVANGALKNTDSILNEFKIKNSTLGAEVDKLGKSLSSAFTNSAFSDAIKSIVSGLANLFDNTKKVSEIMAEERKQLMMTETELFSYNVGNENRTKLINELKQQYPQYLGLIDAETAGNEELHRAIDKVNASLINKIVIQKKDEEIQELADEAGTKKLKATEARIKMIETLTEAYNSNARAAKYQNEMEGLPIELQAEEMIKPENFNKAGLSQYNTTIIELTKNISDWKKAQIAANAASMPLTDALNAKNEIMKALGIETTNAAAADIKKTNTSKTLSEEEIKAAEKAKEARNKLLDDLKAIAREQELLTLDINQRELQIVYDKYDKLREAAKGNKDDLTKIQSLEDNEVMTLLIKQTERQAAEEQKAFDERLKRYEKFRTEKEKLENYEPNKEGLTPADKAELETKQLAKEWDNRIALSKVHNSQLHSDEQQFAIDITKLEDAKNADLIRLQKKHISETEKLNKQKLNHQIDDFNNYWQMVARIGDAYINAQNKLTDYELSKNQTKAEKDVAQQKKLLEQKLITQEEYEANVQKIEDEKTARERQLKREQAQREKNWAMFKIAISTAIAVMQAYANYDYYGAVAAAAVGVIELAAVASEPLPEYAKGGYNNTSNNPQGFTKGATRYTNSASGQDFIAGEAGTEYIVPNWMVNDPVVGPQVEALEKIRLHGYAGGGYNTNVQPLSKTNVTQSAANVYSAAGASSSDIDIVKALTALTEILKKPIAAEINYDVMTKQQEEINSARKSAQIRS